MFIRKKIKNLKGKSYIQHQLLKSIRTSSGPRQEVILNLGELDLPKNEWKTLADAIENKVNNQDAFSFLKQDESIIKLAEHFAQMIISKKLNEHRVIQQQEPALLTEEEFVEEDEQHFENVDVNSVKTTESKSIGAEYILNDQMNQYGIDEILSDAGMDANQIDYAKILIIGRAVHPSSERETARWVNENSGVKELINSDVKVYDNALHRTAVALWKNRTTIEERLRKKAKDLFSLEEKFILYDLTNTYFEGRKENCQIAQHGGHSKEKRNDCKQVTLALVVDAQGFPKESKVLKGNISEPSTLSDILKEVKKMGSENEKKTIVIDAGIASEENIALIKKEKMSYVAISRKQKYDSSLWKNSKEKEVMLNDNKTKLRLKLAIVEDEQNDDENEKEAFLLCQSPLKEIKEKQILEKRMNNFEEALTKIKKGLKKSRTQKTFGKIMERIGRLKEKYHIGSCFDIEVKHENNVTKEIIFTKNPKGKAKLENLGEYVIRTNRLDLNEEEISCIHRSLTNIENAFRSMKSELGMRPNYHKNEESTIAHIFITVVAYHIVCAIIKRLSHAGMNSTWATIRNILSPHDRAITCFNTDDNHCIYIRNTTNANLSQKKIYDKLRLKHDPLKNIKIKIPIKEQGKM